MVGMGWAPEAAGGLNRYFRELHDSLVLSGAEVRPIVLGEAASAPATARVVSSPAATAPGRLLALERAVRAARPDTDVFNTHFAMHSFLPTLTHAFGSRPVVNSFHGPWAAESSAAGARPQVVAVKRALERYTYKRADRTIVLSEAFRLQVCDLGVPAATVSVVHPGVDLNHFHPLDDEARRQAKVRLGLPLDRPIAVSVRRLVPRMGLDVLIAAWALLRTRTEANPVLHIVGEGPSRPELESRVREAGLTDCVHFAGRVPDDLLPQYYACSDLAVTPTLELEGWGLVLLEALACGAPVLASDVGGIAEALRGLERPSLVPAGDVESLASALEARLSQPVRPAERQGCRTYAEGFTWSRTAQGVRSVFAEAITGDGNWPESRRSP